MARLLSRLRREHDVAPPAEAGGREANADSAEPGAAIAPLNPLTIRQWLWGPGFATPGDAAYVLGLVKPFAANPAMSMLDVAAGLGGPARAIAEAFGTYITGLERDAELARLGMQMSTAAGMQKRAPVSPIDPETFELRAGAFDCILGRGATYMVQDKERFLRVLGLGIKPRGQLLLADFVADTAALDRPEFITWSALQPHPPRLWTLQQYTDCLKSLGFDLRITEDISEAYKMQIVLGWDRLVREVKLKALPRLHKLQVVDEAERWVKTIAAIEAGVVKPYRFYALAGSTRPAPLSSPGKKGGRQSGG